ncbi:MAG: galactose-1-phosphate uridylyltransferase [Acidobacteria bacterium]|nr:galactose-1-phosphate uridylyltransferase [Acidobacteriota bacterium]MBI3657884.1 galactose-1-phosphate uridylyltransferase [Acidobacteriota bacterium]
MPELRHDPIQKRWVIIATERNMRPNDFIIEPETDKATFCPFDEGHEDRTPPEIFAVRDPGSARNGPGWKLRVVSNKFPALKIEGELDRRAVGLYDRMNGVGAHEVIIETTDHDAHMSDLPVEQLKQVLYAYRERLNDLRRDKRFKYVLLFKNHGQAAGASLAHPHTQLIATPVTPLTVAKELQSAKDHFHLKERCLVCDIIAQELSSGERIIKATEQFVAFTPYASRFPFEIFLVPRTHHHDFGQISDYDTHYLAEFLKDVMARLKVGLNDPPYNFLLHTSPNTTTSLHRSWYWNTIQYDWHWHLEIIPRLTRVAGFEWGSGFYINPTPPEQAAEYLRELELT